MAKLWGGRFQAPTKEEVDRFNASIPFDQRLYKQDIAGSIAHATMLAKTGIISNAERDQIVSGLKQVLEEIEAGKFTFALGDEDIHMAVEKRLTQIIGDVGKKLHTARSRNDQVATDLRLYARDEIATLQKLLLDLQNVLVAQAEKHTETLMPGYTHLQRAQPVLLAHHLLAYQQMFSRDFERLTDLLKRVNVMPLGSGALAGTPQPIDRTVTAELLNFPKISENSLDAVSDRDYVVEFDAAASLIMMHLSRFCEELILWSSTEFGFIEIGDEYTTGSSLMPQKKNPDVAELIRGKTGRVYGDLMAILTTLKGLPLAYNKDMQEDKEGFFDTVDTVKSSLSIFTSMLESTAFKKEVMEQACRKDYSNATDVADYLVKKGVPFRDAHEITGKLVYHAIQKQQYLLELPLETYRTFSELIEKDIYDKISPRASAESRVSYGGTSSLQVKKAISRAKESIKTQEKLLKS